MRRMLLPRWLVPVAVAIFALAPGAASAAPPSDPWTGPDKALHFTASAALAGGGYALAALGVEGTPGRLAGGAALALGAGAAKEAFDAAGFGTPSWRDVAWDVAGLAFGLLFSAAVDHAARPAWFAAPR